MQNLFILSVFYGYLSFFFFKKEQKHSSKYTEQRNKQIKTVFIKLAHTSLNLAEKILTI